MTTNITTDPKPPQPPHVFISFTRNDGFEATDLRSTLNHARVLRRALEEVGYRVFLDESTLEPGDVWLERIEAAVTECQLFVVLLGARGLDRWVGFETRQALVQHVSAGAGQPYIVPVLLHGAPLPRLLRTFHGGVWPAAASATEMPEVPSTFLLGLKSVLAKAAQALHAWEPERPPGEPYRGLMPFQKEEAGWFFGRERDVLLALDRLGQQKLGSGAAAAGVAGKSGYQRWLSIVGSSGSGKSSLMRAGLLPLVDDGVLASRTGLQEWQVVGPLLPGEQPVLQLARKLAEALQPEGQRNSTLLHEVLASSPRDEVLANWLADQLAGRRVGVLLVVDQFEELFTLAQPAERLRFDRLLATALRERGGALHLLTTMRSDYLGHVAEKLPALAVCQQECCGIYPLAAMNEAGLRQVIEGPARLAGLDVAEVLRPLLDDALDDPDGALPLVQHAPHRLHELARQRGVQHLSFADYEREGRLAGLLATQADTLLDELARRSPAHRKGGLALLASLVRYSPSGRHTRRPRDREAAVRQAGLGKAQRGEEVLQVLSGQASAASTPGERELVGRLRLVVVDEALNEAGQRTGKTRVDLVHEALARQRPGQKPEELVQGCWPTLWEAVQQRKDADRRDANLEHDAQAWAQAHGPARWWAVPGLLGAWPHLGLRHLAGPLERRFIQWAQGKMALQASTWALALGVVGHGLWWVNSHNLPVGYVFKPLVWGLQLWRLGLDVEGSLPTTVPLPPAPPGFMLGCLPERDGKCGDDEAPHPADLPRPCAMAVVPVTYEQWDHYLWATGQPFKQLSYAANNQNRARLPVVEVSYQVVQGYLAWLNGLTGGPRWRLPTEQEWEYAARAPGKESSKSGRHWWGDEDPKTHRLANCRGCKGGVDGLAPVGSYRANAFGLYDMLGNVWQWTQSVYTKDNRPFQGTPEQEKAAANDSDVGRVLRGGSWGYSPAFLGAARRVRNVADVKNNDIGFRVCRASPFETLPTGAAGH